MGRRLFRCGQNDRRAVHVIASEHADGTLAQGIIRYDAEERAVDFQVGQCQRDIRFTSAVADFKVGRHTDLVIIRRGQTHHDFTECNKPVAGIAADQRIMMFHIISPVLCSSVFLKLSAGFFRIRHRRQAFPPRKRSSCCNRLRWYASERMPQPQIQRQPVCCSR